MAAPIVAEARARLQLAPVLDSQGRTRFIPQLEYDALVAAGVSRLTVTLHLTPSIPSRRKPKREAREVRALRAVVLLEQHPEWTDAQVADALGVSRPAVLSWPEYRRARRMVVNEPPVYKDREGNK